MHQITVPIVDNTVDVVFSRAIVPVPYSLFACMYVCMCVCPLLCFSVSLLLYFLWHSNPVQQADIAYLSDVPGPIFWTVFRGRFVGKKVLAEKAGPAINSLR